MRGDPCQREGCPGSVTRAKALYCSQACRQAVWRAKHGLVLQTRRKPSLRRQTRDGAGVRLYLSPDEAQELLRLPVPLEVRAKLLTKLGKEIPWKG
jgi:hypothetical protein